MEPLKNIIPLALRVAGYMALCTLAVYGQEFVHPGLLHNSEDLDRIREKIRSGSEPWVSGWDKLQSVEVSSLDYKATPIKRLVVASGGKAGAAQQYDAGAAHFHAIQWCITGKEAHAHKAIEIINDWSYELEELSGSNAMLQAGITGFKFCNAAEILKYTYHGWSAEDVAKFEQMMRGIYYPVIRDFSRLTTNGNWDAYMMLTMISIGVFLDDREIFNRAVDYFHTGKGKGAITHYVFESGQCQESNRDQFHVQMGLGALAGTCEIAYKQGVDLYGAFNNRLLKGYEFSARYNLGYPVVAEGELSSRGQGRFQPIWEIAHNHYVKRLGLKAEFTSEVIKKIRPEGFHHDFISFGTLFFVDE
ncbi:MAG: alginate lyase family protein [Verrucomicrobiota bacterium]